MHRDPPYSLLALVVLITMAVVACGDDEATPGDTAPLPDWLESVYPEPGATVAVPDAVEVDHTLQRVEHDVRLIIDGVDVTTYATFEAAKIRYESGDGPIELGDRRHTATVQRVRLPAYGVDYQVVDSFTWEFGTA